LSAQVSAAVTSRVAIRMAPGIESLNVAVATGILLHALRLG
jgi:TrmH family RNA methyltransferase